MDSTFFVKNYRTLAIYLLKLYAIYDLVLPPAALFNNIIMHHWKVKVLSSLANALFWTNKGWHNYRSIACYALLEWSLWIRVLQNVKGLLIAQPTNKEYY